MATEANEPELPELLDCIAEATSLEIAGKVARAFGGTEIFLTKKITADHKLAKAVGLPAAQAIREALGYGQYFIPMGQKFILRERREDIYRNRNINKIDELARYHGVSARTVWRDLQIMRREIENDSGRQKS
ncbi:MAG: Mor transcription activator family protein [Rhodospirillales bacterium]